MLPVLTLRGDPYAIGCGLGRWCAGFARALPAGTPMWRSLLRWRGSERLRRMERRAREAYPRYWRELEGLADGSGLDRGDVFLWNCRGDLQEESGDGCSSIAVAGRSRHLIAHNEDGSPGFRGHCALARVQPEAGPAFVCFVYPLSLPGNAFAVNAAGLVQTINNLRAHDARAGVPRQFVARAVVDARTLDDALAELARGDRASGYHHLLARAGEPRLLSVEAPASGVSVAEVEGAAAHTNHLLAGPLAHVPQRITASSAARQRRLTELCRGLPGGLNAPGLRRALADRSGAEHPVYREDPADADGEVTLASAVFEVSSAGVRWSAYTTPAGPADFNEEQPPPAAR